MKQNLEKIAAADFMLQQFKIGRWCIEIHEQQKPCLYADDIFWDIMGMPGFGAGGGLCLLGAADS